MWQPQSCHKRSLITSAISPHTQENLFVKDFLMLRKAQEKHFTLRRFSVFCVENRKWAQKKEIQHFFPLSQISFFYSIFTLMLIQPLLLHPLYPFLFKASIILTYIERKTSLNVIKMGMTQIIVSCRLFVQQRERESFSTSQRQPGWMLLENNK